MIRWFKYIKERFPIPVYFLLVGGFIMSGAALARVEYRDRAITIALGFFSLLVFFFQLRLMDELKDLEKDKKANPTRPLPRGLISVDEASRMVFALNILMLTLGVLQVLIVNPLAGSAFLVVTGYLYLMYKEFFLGARLQTFPLTYAISHQLVVVPICIYSVELFGTAEFTLGQWPGKIPESLHLGFLIMGAFFCYEVSRKLDPKSDPVLKNYVSVYGSRGSALIGMVALLFSGLWALQMQLPIWVTLVEAIGSMVLLAYALNPKLFKLAELSSSLVLLLHLWCVPIGVF